MITSLKHAGECCILLELYSASFCDARFSSAISNLQIRVSCQGYLTLLKSIRSSDLYRFANVNWSRSMLNFRSGFKQNHEKYIPPPLSTLVMLPPVTEHVSLHSKLLCKNMEYGTCVWVVGRGGGVQMICTHWVGEGAQTEKIRNLHWVKSPNFHTDILLRVYIFRK